MAVKKYCKISRGIMVITSKNIPIVFHSNCIYSQQHPHNIFFGFRHHCNNTITWYSNGIIFLKTRGLGGFKSERIFIWSINQNLETERPTNTNHEHKIPYFDLCKYCLCLHCCCQCKHDIFLWYIEHLYQKLIFPIQWKVSLYYSFLPICNSFYSFFFSS